MQLVDRYGPALDYDLHARLGLDLLDWIRGKHPWEQLLWLAEQLPRTSRYKAALYDDDEVAEQWVALHGHPDDTAPALPGLDEWTPERAQLVQLTEAIMGLHRTLIAVNNRGKAPEVKPLPRPRTAWDRVSRRHNVTQAQAVVLAFSPKKAPEIAG